MNFLPEITAQITKYEKAGVTFDIPDAPCRAEEKVWSLWSNYFGEVNAYRLTLPQAINMIDEAVEEDGFEITDLIIWAPYKNAIA